MKNKQEEIRLFITGLAVEHTFSSDDIATVKKQNKYRLRDAKKDDFLLIVTRIFSIISAPLTASIIFINLIVSLISIGLQIDPSIKLENLNFSFSEIFSLWITLYFVLLVLSIGIKILKSNPSLPLSNYRKQLYIALYRSLGVDFHKAIRMAVIQHIADKNPFIEYNAIFHIDNPRFFETFFDYEVIPMKKMDELLRYSSLYCENQELIDKQQSTKTEAKNV